MLYLILAYLLASYPFNYFLLRRPNLCTQTELGEKFILSPFTLPTELLQRFRWYNTMNRVGCWIQKKAK